ncbi:MAG: hypothetical protein JSS02_20775 [Planctomycetes bacterium]|nr:hypothetical protein [Planctomycetota bacterium]
MTVAAWAPERVGADGAAPGLACGDCGACCVLLPIVELNKPGRWACDHLTRQGCGCYDERPGACREFHCVWLRGALGSDVALRPDRLGVMFDWFQIRGTGEECCQALELWPGAFDDARVGQLLQILTTRWAVNLLYRDSRRSTLPVSVAGVTD